MRTIGDIVGVISNTDLTELYGRSRERCARDAMTPEVLRVSAAEPMAAAIRTTAFERVHQLVVVDEHGSFAGVVTSMGILCELAGYGRAPPRVMAVAP